MDSYGIVFTTDKKWLDRVSGEGFPDFYSDPLVLRNFLKSTRGLLLALEYDQLVGFAYSIAPDSLSTLFPQIIIHPQYENQGIEDILLKTFELLSLD